MNTRKTLPGGEIGISSNEINLMPEANREGMHGINNGLSEGANMIISGVNAVINPGVNVTVQDGFVFLDGEMLKVDAQVVPRTAGTDLYEFQKIVGSIAPDGDRNFRDGSSANVYEANRAVPVNVGSINTISVDGDTITDVLKTIIRIQADWNQSDNTQPDFIKNKPALVSNLMQGRFNIGQIGIAPIGANYTVFGGITSAQKVTDGASEEVISVTFPDVGTSNYQVLGTIMSAGVNPLHDNDVTWVIFNRTNTSFQFSIAGKDQNEFVDVLLTLIPIDES